MSRERVPEGVPTGGQFAASVRQETDVALTGRRWEDWVDTLALDDMEPGERRTLVDVPAEALIEHGYSAEYDSTLHGLGSHLNSEKVAAYAARATATCAPPVLVALPPPGEEDDGPTLIDGHHRLFAAQRAGRPLAVEVHAPVLDRDGEVDHPTLPARFGGLA